METRQKRTQDWLNASPNGPKADADYETSNNKIKKESFNYGQVPFGSHSKQQFLYQTRVTHNLPTIGAPGPGAYGTSISPRDDQQVLGRKLSPGFSFSKIGLQKNGSGTRDMLFQKPITPSKHDKVTISKTRKNSTNKEAMIDQTLANEVSLKSLRQKTRMFNMDSNPSLNIRPMPSETARTRAFPGSPSSTNLQEGGFNAIIKD